MKLGTWVVVGRSTTHVVCRHQMHIFDTSFAYLFWLANNKEMRVVYGLQWQNLVCGSGGALHISEWRTSATKHLRHRGLYFGASIIALAANFPPRCPCQPLHFWKVLQDNFSFSKIKTCGNLWEMLLSWALMPPNFDFWTKTVLSQFDDKSANLTPIFEFLLINFEKLLLKHNRNPLQGIAS